MTSKLTREQATDTEIQMLIDSHEKGTAMFMRTDAYYFMAKELQERRKADGEPVAYMYDGEDGREYNGHNEFSGGGKVIPLYRHAQPAPTSGEPVGYLFHNKFGAVLYSISDDATEGFSLIGPIYSAPQPAPDDYFSSLVSAARLRADKAMCKYPQPNYVLNKVAEESGEVIKAVIHYHEGREEWASVEAELIDNLAMLIRLVVEGDQVIGFTPPEVCRAAMLQAGTLTNEDAILPVTQLRPVSDLYGITSPTGSETMFTFDPVEASNLKEAGWSVQEYVELERLQEAVAGNFTVNEANVVNQLTITLPDTGSKAFWSGTGKTEIFLPVAYRRWVKEAIERYCAIARIDVEVK